MNLSQIEAEFDKEFGKFLAIPDSEVNHNSFTEQEIKNFIRSKFTELLESTKLKRTDIKDKEYKTTHPSIKEKLTKVDLTHFRNGFYQAISDQDQLIKKALE